MKNWSAIAAASGIDIPPADIERIVKPLEALEDAFRPLAGTLTIARRARDTFCAARRTAE